MSPRAYARAIVHEVKIWALGGGNYDPAIPSPDALEFGRLGAL